MKLMCVAKVDTFDGKTYEAHIWCQSREDGLAVMSQLDSKDFEPVGCAFKPVVRREASEYKLTNDIFISCRCNDPELSDIDAMENLYWEIEKIIR